MGQFQYLTGLNGPKEGTYLYETKFLSLKVNINIYQKIPKPCKGPLNYLLEGGHNHLIKISL